MTTPPTESAPERREPERLKETFVTKERFFASMAVMAGLMLAALSWVYSGARDAGMDAAKAEAAVQQRPVEELKGRVTVVEREVTGLKEQVSNLDKKVDQKTTSLEEAVKSSEKAVKGEVTLVRGDISALNNAVNQLVREMPSRPR